MRRQSGFTLLELLISLSIFALIGVMAYGGLNQVLIQRAVTEARAQSLADLQKAYLIMQRDLEQLINRGIRNEFGDNVAALVGGSGFRGVEFSRAGRSNPAGFLRSDLQRVSYLADQDTLRRRTWRVLDRAQDSLPDDEILVEHLRRFSIRFLSTTNQWLDNWPPQQTLTQTPALAPVPGAVPGAIGATAIGLPRAVRVELELDEIGTLSWTFVLPQNFIATPLVPGGGANPAAGDSGDGAATSGTGAANAEQEGES